MTKSYRKHPIFPVCNGPKHKKAKKNMHASMRQKLNSVEDLPKDSNDKKICHSYIWDPRDGKTHGYGYTDKLKGRDWWRSMGK